MRGKVKTTTKTSGSDVCEVSCIHPAAVEQVKKQALNRQAATELSQIFQVMADPSRLCIISVLAQQELCVCDVAAALDMTRSAISHQLRVMRMAGLVKFRKEGRIAYYSLDDDHVLKMFTLGLSHLGNISSGKKGQE